MLDYSHCQELYAFEATKGSTVFPPSAASSGTKRKATETEIWLLNTSNINLSSYQRLFNRIHANRMF